MRQLPNIAFIARMRAGKDSCYEILQEWGFPVVRIAFGDSMKEMYHLENPDVPRTPKPIAEYIKFGQSKREEDPDIFVNATMSKLWFEQALDRGHDRQRTYVVTDVRQPNEFQAVVDAGFVIIKVHASEEVRIARMKSNGEAVSRDILDAETESYIDTFSFDYRITNNWDRDNLKRQLARVVKELILEDN